jgi:hypothetical protein
MDDLGGKVAKTADAENFQGFAVEQQLEDADGATGDLRAPGS